MYLPEGEYQRLIELKDRKGLSINQTATALFRIGMQNCELPEEIDGNADAPGGELTPEDREVREGDSRASGDRVGPEEEVIDFRKQYDAVDVRG